jgi:hypothetical protein
MRSRQRARIAVPIARKAKYTLCTALELVTEKGYNCLQIERIYMISIDREYTRCEWGSAPARRAG